MSGEIIVWGQKGLAFAVAFGILVFVHEFGHYIVAKLCGVTVEVFSFGFGRRLLGFSRGGTDYRVSLVPLGGYVKMLGEMPEEEEEAGEDPGSFSMRPKWQRFLVLVAGAAMNIVLAIVCYTVFFTHGYFRPVYLDEPPVVGGLTDGLPAREAGLQPGDRILSFNGERLGTWEDFVPLEALSPDRDVTLEVDRDGEVRTFTFRAASAKENITNSKLGQLGIEPRTTVVAAVVNPSMPAIRAGMQQGDIIESVDGVEIVDAITLIETIRASDGRPLPFVLKRDGERIEMTITPKKGAQGHYLTGFSPGYKTREYHYAFVPAFTKALQETWDQTFFTYRVLKKLVTREVGLGQMSGPIGIFQVTGRAAEQGWLSFLRVLGLISLQLGIINLLPIPVLDGGHIFVLLIEGVMRRELSVRLKERMVHVGLIFLMVLMAVVIFNDISKNVPGGLHRFLPWGGE